MKNIDELLGVAKLSELMSNDKKDESKKVLWILAIIGAVAAVQSMTVRSEIQRSAHETPWRG